MSQTRQPIWPALLRGTFLCASLGLHGLAFAAFQPTAVEQDAPITGLELSFAPPQGETVAEEKDLVDSSAQTETTASIQQAPTPPPEPVQDLAEAAKVVDPDADTMEAAVKPPEPVPPVEPPPETVPEPQVEKVESAPPAQAQAAAEETFAQRAVGVETGLRTNGGVTRAAYAAAVKKEITKNRRRAASASHGTVNVSFVIGPLGSIETVHVVKSAGTALDDTARSIVAAIHVPPPPGGTFSASIAIRFE